MFPAWNRLRKIDIYAAEEAKSDYIGKKLEPRLLGYVYADVQRDTRAADDRREGMAEKASVRLFLRPDAGIRCGDLAAVYGKTPDSRITEVRRSREYVSAVAERI